MTDGPAPNQTSSVAGRRSSRWLSWVTGAAALAAVIVVALHLSEGRELVRLAQSARPWWLVVALFLQAATYAAQGEVWRRVGAAANFRLRSSLASGLSLAKLFVDQVLPSAGISGSVVVIRALEQRGMSRPAVMAAMVLTIASYYAAFVVGLVGALLIAVVHHEANPLVGVIAVAVGAVALAIAILLPALAGRRIGGGVRKVRLLRSLLDFLAEADPRLTRSPRLFAISTLHQLAIILLDAATVWVLIRAIGFAASPSGVFASFMISNLFRTIGVLPGGLGTFEATSVVTLRMIGVPIPIALAATLLFRGLSFWLPMGPGLWLSRRLTAPHRTPGTHEFAGNAYWAVPASELIERLGSDREGLSTSEAARRLCSAGRNEIAATPGFTRLRVLWNQVRSPLLLLLLFAAAVSIVTGEWRDAVIVITIVVATVLIGYQREYRAQTVAAALRARVRTRATAVRDRQPRAVAVEELVPGDVILLSAGSLVPADGVVLEATDCYVSESALTGESFPVTKRAGVVPESTPLARRTNCVALGTNVRSGTAQCLVVRTGPATELGAVQRRLTAPPPATEFDRGLRRFGYLLTIAMLVIVFMVFVAHVLGGRPPGETLLFSIALAVGLSPELMPVILNVNLARGAELMARHGVLVRHLNAIENLGSMDVLCTDKTGTLTEGVVRLEGAYDPSGVASPEVLELGAINATFESGLPSPLDDAIVAARAPDRAAVNKLGEIPFDFVRKRVSVVVERDGAIQLVAKGSFHSLVRACSRLPDGSAIDDSQRARLERRHEDWTSRGIRVLGVAVREIARQPLYGRDDEQGLTFAGFLTFLDQPKEGVSGAIAALSRLGVSIKVISGDDRRVARHVAGLVGLRSDRVLTGADLERLPDAALRHAAPLTDLFAEVDPHQKERVILALQKSGHVVGFLGDGVNDAPAMHAADTSLSVDQAVDVARETADFVLLEKDLDVIRRGIEEGRRTFANTLKYVLTTTSANLGNMISMAAASLFLPFLPLLAGQILLNNFVSDIPAVGIAADGVDPELVARPRRWDNRFIARFMAEFGLLSCVFDFLTFGLLLGVFHAGADLFRTGWFIESLLTELVIALVVRTRRPFFRSRPGSVLLATTLALIPIAFAIPYLPQAAVFGFVAPPASLLLALAGVTALYVLAAETLKRWFYPRAAAQGS